MAVKEEDAVPVGLRYVSDDSADLELQVECGWPSDPGPAAQCSAGPVTRPVAHVLAREEILGRWVAAALESDAPRKRGASEEGDRVAMKIAKEKRMWRALEEAVASSSTPSGRTVQEPVWGMWIGASACRVPLVLSE